MTAAVTPQPLGLANVLEKADPTKHTAHAWAIAAKQAYIAEAIPELPCNRKTRPIHISVAREQIRALHAQGIRVNCQ